MRLSTSLNVLFGCGSARQQLARARRAGFSYIDMNLVNWANPRYKLPLSGDSWQSWAEETAEAASQLSIAFNQAHGSKRINLEGDMHAQEAEAEKMLRAAAIMGIPRVVFHAGDIAGTLNADGSENLDRMRECMRLNRAFFLKLAETAAQMRIALAIENTFKPGCLTSSLARHIELIDSMEGANVSACWDIGHAHCAGVSQSDSILALGTRLSCLHVQDNDGTRDQHTAPYYGTIDWGEVMRALSDAHYKGDFTFEAPNFIRPLPDALKDCALRLLYEIGAQLSDSFASDQPQ